MPKISIEAPTDKVFEAMCDLTRHVKWAKHNIVIKAEQEGPPAVGHNYTSSESGNAPDRLTITEMVPNELFKFHSFMSRGMGWEFDFTMTAKPEGGGTVVTRDAKIIKFPILMLPMRLVLPLMAPKLEKQCLDNMKADLESGPSA